MSIRGIREFVHQNGWYLLGDEIATRLAGSLRGYLLASRLGSHGFRIGPDCYVRGLRYLKVGRDFRAGRGLWLEAVGRYNEQVFSPQIVIGNRVRASEWVHIAATHYVGIGDDCLFGSRILITDHGHGQYKTMDSMRSRPPGERPLDSMRSVVIGRNVWIGDGVVVLPDVEIGDGAVIGANSVVSRSIPPFAVAAGAPAQVIRQFDLTSA